MSILDILIGLDTPKLVIPSDFAVKKIYFLIRNNSESTMFLILSQQIINEIGLYHYLVKIKYGQYL